MNVTFERAGEERVSELVAFEETLGHDPFYTSPLPYDKALEELRKNAYFFVMLDGEMVGTCGYEKRKDGSFYLNNIAVLPTHRGQGIAKRAFRFLLDACEGAERIDLTVHPDNRPARSVYESFGFRPESIIENCYGDGEPRLVMVKYTAHFAVIPHNSAEYRQAIALREEILRKPLGLTFSAEELAAEALHLHIAGFLKGDIAATCVLVPEGTKMKMQRVAVREDVQGKGIGSQMMVFCEALAQSRGVKEITVSARAAKGRDAVQFYLNHGYEAQGGLFEEDGIPHRRMRKLLYS